MVDGAGKKDEIEGRVRTIRKQIDELAAWLGAEDVVLSDHGSLWGFTAVTAAPPGYAGPVPFGFGIVELPEGLRIITRIEEPDPARLTFGMAMTLTTAEVGEQGGDGARVTYSFAPSGST